jgi:hypothetical protein
MLIKYPIKNTNILYYTNYLIIRIISKLNILASYYQFFFFNPNLAAFTSASCLDVPIALVINFSSI